MPQLDQLKDVIAAASQSFTSFAACLLLVLASIAFSWFSNAEYRIKIGIFVALFVGGFGLLWAVYAPPAPPSKVDAVARANYVIDLQYADNEDKALKLQSYLQDKGWVVYGVDHKTGFRPSIIKFSADSNNLAATALKNDVGASRMNAAPLRFARDPAIKATHLELWVGFE